MSQLNFPHELWVILRIIGTHAKVSMRPGDFLWPNFKNWPCCLIILQSICEVEEEAVENNHAVKHFASGKNFLSLHPRAARSLCIKYSRMMWGTVLLSHFLMAHIKLKKAIFPPNLSGVAFPGLFQTQ
jgi:hypothetical protein